MQRRARIKAVVNLSSSRRAAKVNSENVKGEKSEVEESKKKSSEKEIAESTNKLSQSPLESSSADSQSTSATYHDDKNKSSESDAAKLNEKSKQPDPAVLSRSEDKLSSKNELSNLVPDEPTTFKTPLQLPRAADNEMAGTSSSQSNANKFKRFKMAPRLTAPRNVPKVHVSITI
jgi:hypothetical protein